MTVFRAHSSDVHFYEFVQNKLFVLLVKIKGVIGRLFSLVFQVTFDDTAIQHSAAAVFAFLLLLLNC